MSAEPLALRLRSGLCLRGLAFGAGEGATVVALHGWLDNAMSFAPLAAAWPEVRLLALEWPGHGHSDHRPPGGWYHFVDYLEDLELALDALGLRRAILLGHSLGAAVASIFAAAAPERVAALLLVEGLGPLALPPERALEALRQGLAARAKLREREAAPRYDDLAPLVAARAAAGGLRPEHAALLVERSLKRTPEGWRWRSDPRLTAPAPLRPCEESVLALLAGIRCPVALALAAPPSAVIAAAALERRLAAIPRARILRLAGGHHLHMERPAELAAFFAETLATLG